MGQPRRGATGLLPAGRRQRRGRKGYGHQNLDGFAARLALYFSDIVRNELPVEALTDVLEVHDKHLIDQVNAYAVNDYAKAQQMQLEGYQQMLGVANTLVGAIEEDGEARAAGRRLEDRRRWDSTAATMTRRRRRLAVGVAALALLAGCAGSDPPRRPGPGDRLPEAGPDSQTPEAGPST